MDRIVSTFGVFFAAALGWAMTGSWQPAESPKASQPPAATAELTGLIERMNSSLDGLSSKFDKLDFDRADPESSKYIRDKSSWEPAPQPQSGSGSTGGLPASSVIVQSYGSNGGYSRPLSSASYRSSFGSTGGYSAPINYSSQPAYSASAPRLRLFQRVRSAPVCVDGVCYP